METANLRLIPDTPEHLRLRLQNPAAFEQRFGVRVLPEVNAFLDDAADHYLAELLSTPYDPWQHGYLVVHRDDKAVIGVCAYKGPPDETGAVEIAYGIVSNYQNRGYATEVAAALVENALRDPGVGLVVAHTLAEPNASTRVLEKCGFQKTAEIMDPEDGLIWRWENKGERDKRERGNLSL